MKFKPIYAVNSLAAPIFGLIIAPLVHVLMAIAAFGFALLLFGIIATFGLTLGMDFEWAKPIPHLAQWWPTRAMATTSWIASTILFFTASMRRDMRS